MRLLLFVFILLFFPCFIMLADTIQIGTLSCPGKEWQVSDKGITLLIKQPRVINQFTKQGTGGASCGYHALFNTEQILQAFKQSMSSLNSPQLIQEKFGEKGSWRQTIIKERENYKGEKKGNWVDNFELMDLAGAEKIDVTVFAQPEEIGAGECFDDTARVKEEIERGIFQQQAYCLGSMSQKTTYINDADTKAIWSSQRGHWICVVLHKLDDTTYELIIADSASDNSLLSIPVQRLIQVIFGNKMHADVVMLGRQSLNRVLSIVSFSDYILKLSAAIAVVYGSYTILNRYFTEDESSENQAR